MSAKPHEAGLVVQQFAALPWKRGRGEPLVMLVTTRGAGRWIVPKGWAEPALTGPQLAAKEAFEEAGILGEADTMLLGSYSYWKQLSKHRRVRCQVDVFPLRVTQLLAQWPEAKQRRREWLTLAQASARIDETELASLLQALNGRQDWWDQAAVIG